MSFDLGELVGKLRLDLSEWYKGLAAANGSANSMSTSIAGAARSAFGGISTAIVAVGSAVTGLAISGGINRALAIEQAQAKLKGLGHDAGSVTQIMANALGSVKGTAYGLGDAAGVAASMVAAGVKQGEQLETVLKTVADVSTIAGRDMASTGLIFQSIAARGKLQGDDMLQLMGSGVPVLQLLANTLGKTSAEVSDMVSKGKIDFATFEKAMREGMGGAALKSGETFNGAMANTKAALGRLGAEIATPAMAALKGIFNDAIPVIDKVTAGLKPLIQGLANSLSPVIAQVSKAVSEFLKNVDFSKIVEGFSQFGAVLAPLGGLMAAVGGANIATMLGPLAPLLPAISGPLGMIVGLIAALVAQSPALRAGIMDVFRQFAPLLSGILPLAMGLIGFVSGLAVQVANLLGGILSDVAPLIGQVLSQVGSALNSAKPALLALGQAIQSGLGWLVDNRTLVLGIITAIGAGFLGYQAVIGVITTVQMLTRAWTAAQAALNIVLNLNPIGLVVMAIAALVAGLIYAYHNSETFRNFVNGLGAAIMAAWGAVVEFFRGLPAFFSNLWATITSSVTSFVSGVGNWFAQIPVRLSELGSAIGTFLTSLPGLFLQGLINTGNAVLTGIGWIIGFMIMLPEIIRAYSTLAINWLVGTFTQGWAWTVTTVSTGVANIISFVQQLPGRIQALVTQAVNWLVTTMVTGWANAVNAVSSGVSRTISFVQQLPGQVLSYLTQMAQTVLTQATAAANNLANTLKSGVDQAVSWVRGLPGQILSILNGLASDAYNAAFNIGSRIVQGIRDTIDKIKSAAKDAMSAIAGTLPRSPADYGPFSGNGWGGWGEAIVDQLTKELVGGTGQLALASDRMMRAVSLEGTAGVGFNAGSEAFSGPRYVTLVDTDRSFIARMRVEATGAVEEVFSASTVEARKEVASL